MEMASNGCWGDAYQIASCYLRQMEKNKHDGYQEKINAMSGRS